MKRAKLRWIPIVALIVSLNLLSCGGNSGEGTTTSGMLDTSFGKGGIVTTAIGSGAFAYALAIQSDGKLVAAGRSGEFTLARYNTDGSLDTTFGTGGIVTTAIGSLDNEGNALTIQLDGKLVTAGFSYDLSLSQYEFALARYWP